MISGENFLKVSQYLILSKHGLHHQQHFTFSSLHTLYLFTARTITIMHKEKPENRDYDDEQYQLESLSE